MWNFKLVVGTSFFLCLVGIGTCYLQTSDKHVNHNISDQKESKPPNKSLELQIQNSVEEHLQEYLEDQMKKQLEEQRLIILGLIDSSETGINLIEEIKTGLKITDDNASEFPFTVPSKEVLDAHREKLEKLKRKTQNSF